MAVTGASRTALISRWHGLNENPDGDTKLRTGEAARLRNFRITRDGNLQKRPGTRTAADLGSAPVSGLWSGTVMGRSMLCAVCGREVFAIRGGELEKLGELETAAEQVSIFAFGGSLWFLSGSGFYQWSGSGIIRPAGYVPLVRLGITPGDPGEPAEQLNRLSPLRRVRLSPDGIGTDFRLGERNLKSVDYVRTAAGADMKGWTADTAQGILHFAAPPAEGINSIEICYCARSDDRALVDSMLYCEFYNGSQDSRVFLYGDGTARCIYSGVDESGRPRADYWPALNEISVGEPDTPLMCLMRHHSQLLCFKSGSTYSIHTGFQTAADGSEVPVFYVSPVNRSIGCSTPGQAQLVLNSPFALYGSDLYEWQGAGMESGLAPTERRAVRISDRVYAAISRFDAECTRCFFDSRAQEYYIACGGTALVYGAAVDAWYLYSGIEMRCFALHEGRLYFGTADGRVCVFGQEYYSDETRSGYMPIYALWESGSMSFNTSGRKKYSARLWLSLRPESRGCVDVSVLTARGAEKHRIESRLFGFEHIDFRDFSFALSRSPKVYLLRIRTGAYVYYKLRLESRTGDSTVTVTGAETEIRYTN